MENKDKEIKYWCGTSWHGDYIISTVEELEIELHSIKRITSYKI